jgi:hypothetical protein
MWVLPFSSCTSLIKPKDHRIGHWESSHPNFYLWRRIKDNPALFLPDKLPSGFPITPETGYWVVDSQDNSGFFVPNRDCGGLPPRIWHAEAVKAVNRIGKAEQAAYNAVTVVVGWPAAISLIVLSGI